MADTGHSQSAANVSPNRLLDAPAEYPVPSGTVLTAEVSNVFGRLGWLLTGGDGIEWLPDIAGSDEHLLQGWVRESLRTSRAGRRTMSEAQAAIAAVFIVGEAQPVGDLAAFRAAALPQLR